ncbi:LysR family transcriptional regulator [Actinorugispora endophytica]|uniref:DNA-binding transcriptional LysR family regulator n=1 Tax=Actinorugispora endophytica TaxID=1605990 RepID=A0A4R6V2R5_9ACTN|nr:LysR family transcriptional regulator [Actinorugispora endophytica]TDQ54242.1 DNA-binding transcriptional LysR family regulator [Actinorugispora endophytica]
MADIDLRRLRYFVAVAEERNFTRAAERLMMTQPALSRAIRSLEDDVGTSLLVRGYRDVELTRAGLVLLEQARGVDDQVNTAVRLARRAEAEDFRLRVTARGCDVDVLSRLVSSYNLAGRPVPAVATVVEWQEQGDQLRDGSADVGLMRTPFDERGLDSDELFSEPRVVLLPERHPLARADEVALAQLADQPVARWKGDHRDAFLLWPAEDVPQHEWVPGPVVGDTSQFHAVVRLGQAIGFVPESVSFASVSAGVRAVRVRDAPPSVLRLAWTRTSTSAAVADLVRHATALADGLRYAAPGSPTP